MQFISQYGLFLLKSVTIVLSILFLTAGIFSLARKPKPKFEITCLNKQYDDLKKQMSKEILGHKPPKIKKDKKTMPYEKYPDYLCNIVLPDSKVQLHYARLVNIPGKNYLQNKLKY